MSAKQSNAPQPPQPPEFGREMELRTTQVVGVGILALLVLLALVGLFGFSRDRVSGTGELLFVEVTYPGTIRYGMQGTIEVRVSNEGESPLESVELHLDREYVDRFSDVTFSPSVEEISEEAYIVSLETIPAGESRLVSARVRAEKYWTHVGTVEARAGSESTTVDLSTFVYP